MAAMHCSRRALLNRESRGCLCRLFLSAEPPPALERPLPISILQASIKLTNEPPEGLKANLKRAYSQFSEDFLDSCVKQTEFRSILFALCYFHSTLIERKKFGVGNLPNATSGIGWNMNYPFNVGDLVCCSQCTANYLDNSTKVPWEDLRYMFGEIIYGGHIVEDWDRRLASAYLAILMNETLLENTDLFPQFTPPQSTLKIPQVLAYIEDNMPMESAICYGLHPNAEIGFQRREADYLSSSLLALQPRRASQDKGLSVEERAKTVLDEILEKLPDIPKLDDIRSRLDEPTPFAMVAIQETERMATLLNMIRKSLAEVDLSLRGDLNMSEYIEHTVHALASDVVPMPWVRLAYPSLRPLSLWLIDLGRRAMQLCEWTTSFTLPNSVWISGLFNPQSFLTAVMQTTARKYGWPLDKTIIATDVTKLGPEQVGSPPKEGVYIHGLYLEGARWDEKSGTLENSRLKQFSSKMPVMHVKAVPADKSHVEGKDTYVCPVYATEARFRQEVFAVTLKSRSKAVKWTIAGVCMCLEVIEAEAT